MKSNLTSPKDNPMEKDRVLYDDLIGMIDGYIDGVGITKASADVLMVLSNRLYDKLRVIGPALSFLDNKEEDIYTTKDGIPLKEHESHVP